MATFDITQEATWVELVQRLYDYLQDNDDKINFLRQIDHDMVEESLSLDQFVASKLQYLARLSQASDIHFYVDSGDALLLLNTTTSRQMARVFSLSDLPAALPPECREAQLVDIEDFNQTKEFFPEVCSFLMIPVWLPASKNSQPSTIRFGILILETLHPVNISPLRHQSVQDFAQTAAGQLALGIRFRLEDHRTQWLRRLNDRFFKLDLGPYKCFKELAEEIPDYLPSFGPFHLANRPEVQILIYDNHYLTIVGTTGADVNAKVRVSQSVVGLLFDGENRPYIHGNPKKDDLLKQRYKAYLGKDEGKEIQTELAVPIIDQETRSKIAVVNLESDIENAFTQVHINSILELCDLLSPMISALHDRVIERIRRQTAVLYAQQSYWNTVGSALRHDTNGQLASIRLGVDNAKTAVNLNKPEALEKILDPIYESLFSIEQRIGEFSREIDEYLIYGKYSIRQLVADAILKIKGRLDKQKKGIRLELADGDDFEVYCSALLRMHLFNIIDNAIFWVERRIDQEPGHQGKVSIAVNPGPMPDEDQERDLNLTCEISIEDNGLGCPPDELGKLLSKPAKSRRTGEKGMGYALYAANNYILQLDGSINLESEVGQGFIVTIRIPIFNPQIHQVKGFAEND